MSSLIKIEKVHKELLDELLEENKKLEEINHKIEKHKLIERIISFISSNTCHWPLINFEFVRCGTYQRVALIGGRHLFQSWQNDQC